MPFDRIYTAETIRKPSKKDESILDVYRKAMRITENEFFSSGAVEGRSFAQQAKILKNLEDHYFSQESENLSERFPVYADLTLQQLRRYISWRTKWRQAGLRMDPNALFEMLAAQELTMPGYKNAYEALGDLMRLPSLTQMPNAQKIIRDFVIWNNLPNSAFENPLLDFGSKSSAILLEPEKYDDDTFYNTLIKESFAHVNASISQKRFPSLWKKSLRYIWRALNKATYSPALQTSDFWGQWSTNDVEFFHPRFYPDCHNHADTSYRVNPAQIFICHNGFWQERRLRITRKGKELAKILFADLDRAIRLYKKAKLAHKIPVLPPHWLKVLEETATALPLLESDCRLESLHVDTSLLDQIREQARGVEEKLLLQDTSEPIAPEPAPIIAPPTQLPTDAAIFSTQEKEFLQALFTGADYSHILREAATTLSLYVDTINEKLMSVLGDAAIRLEDGKACILDDYREDIKNLL